MPLDPSSLESGTPTAKDGRTYPRHLKQYEKFDEVFLPIFAESNRPISFDDLIEQVEDRQARAAAVKWINSASWRGLVEATNPRGRRPRAWRAGPRLPADQAA
jgi:hypothetical protein